MTMLPVCSATTGCSSHSQIPVHGGWLPFSSCRKTFEVRCVLEDKVALGLSNEIQGVYLKRQVAKSFCSRVLESNEQSASMNFINMSPCENELHNIKSQFPNNWSHMMGAVSEPPTVNMGDLKFVESSSSGEEELMDLTNQLNEDTDILLKPTNPQTITSIDNIPDDQRMLSNSLNMDSDSLSSVKTSIEDTFSGINDSISASVNKGQDSLRNSLDAISSTVTSAFKGANEAVDNAVSKVISAVDQTGELAGNKLTSFSNDLKETSSKIGIITVDFLRHTIVAAKDSVTRGATLVVEAYGSVKELLSPEIQNVLNLSEESTIKILRPVGTTFQQVYTALEGLERSLGLDPNDPIIPFLLLLGTSVTLWGSYWILTYGGYAGDLAPKLTLELLSGKESAVLIDVRPEDLKERDGIPDLRRAARFRYADVTLLEVNGSIRKLLNSGRDVDDSLTAAVIRNLKIVQDRSKVIVMDADGTRSKGIARSLRKLGVKRPYLVQGGFQNWAKQGLRIKELKPETTLTVLSKEAEAIFEEISPTPLKVLGYGMGFIAAAYALVEWEKTLQLIGIVGLCQTIYRRVASYEDSEDFRQDIRRLLAPVKLGGQAISWAAGKLETNLNGLPTSPSSSDVQIRVLQAAAKHESQPSDSEKIQDPSPESVASLSESVDLSEA